MRVSKLTVSSVFEVVNDRCNDEEIVFLCPEQGCNDKSGNRSVNARSGLTSCWRCGKGGDFYKWARRLGVEVEPDEVSASLDVVTHELDAALADRKKKAVYAVQVPLPRGFQLVENYPRAYQARRISRMAQRKNLTVGDMISAGVGFTDSGDWDAYAIFPVIEWGRVVYYQGRTFDDPDYGSTKKFPSRSVCPYGSRHWVYGIDEARSATKVVIVESILNVLSLRREFKRLGIDDVVPLAVFKHKISAEQVIKLAGLRYLKEMCLMFDSDAISASYGEVAGSESLSKITKTVVEMPEGVDANDDAELAVRLWQQRKPVSRELAQLRILERELWA